MGQTSNDNSTIQIQIVTGGFILTVYQAAEATTEVFVSPGKLIKAVRGLVEGGKDAPPPADEAS